jgi:DNA polymerase-3 subunit delta
MRLRPEEYARSLERGIAPFHLFYGDELLPLLECQDALRTAARAQGFTEREVLDVEPGFDWGALMAACAGMSLFGDRKLVELRIPSGKPGTEGGAVLREITNHASPDTVVSVVLGATDRDTEKAAWFKALETAGVAVRSWPMRRNELAGWIRQRLQAAGFSPAPEAVTMLCERVEGNLLAAKQEIEKLRLLREPGPLDAASLAAVVAESARYTAFDLCDRALEGDHAGAVRTLAGLRAEGEEALAILGAFTWELRKLLTIAERHAGGEPLERAIASQRGEKRHYAAAIRRLGGTGLQGLLRIATRVDRSAKGMERLDPWDELLSLVIAAAGGLARKP